MSTVTDDSRLLAEYALNHAAAPLGQLIERYIDFVYASALRQVLDPGLAEDVTQAVFIILARKAPSIRSEPLSGWLFNTTRHCAANARRGEGRRRRHEQLAAKPEVTMPAPIMQNEPISLLLDEALANLRTADREVVLMHYLQGQDVGAVGSKLGISEQAARKRITRAVERLRQYFKVKGVDVASSSLGAILLDAQLKAPSHLAGIVTTAATAQAKGSAAAGIALKTMQFAAWAQMKVAAAIMLGALVVGVGGVAIVKGMHAQQAQSSPPALIQETPLAAPVDAGNSTAATFSDGMKVELIGINVHPSRNNPWWKPDGSPLERAPYTAPGGSVTGLFGKPFEFAIRISAMPAGTDSRYMGIGPVSSWIPHESKGLSVRAFATVLSPDAPATIRIQFATSAWKPMVAVPAQTVLAAQGITASGISFSNSNDPKNPGGITITSGTGALSKNDGEWQLLAIDQNGKFRSVNSMQTNSGFFTQTTVATFGKVDPKQLKEFQIRTRPFDRWVEFKNVSTTPGLQTDVHVATSKDPGQK